MTKNSDFSRFSMVRLLTRHFCLHKFRAQLLTNLAGPRETFF